MKKGILLAALVLVLVIASVGMAADTHLVSLTVSPFLKFTLSPSTVTFAVDSSTVFTSGKVTLGSASGSVSYSINTNKFTGCKITVYADPLMSTTLTTPETIDASVLQIQNASDGWQSISTSSTLASQTVLKNYTTKTKLDTVPVSFQLKDLPENTTADTYHAYVYYTATANP